jgi:uncharacterized protein (DUF2342 family)
MTKISTYEELVAERKRLEGELLVQKAYIKSKVTAIKEKFEPIGKIISFFGGTKNSNNSSKGSALLKLGSTVGIDLLIGQKLKKAGWLTRMILPVIMKLTAQKTIDTVQHKLSK